MSDSEGAIDNDASSVFLGLVDAPLKENEELSIEDSFIGGEPKWLHKDSVPPEDMLICGACKSRDSMRLLLQAFSPLDYEQMEDIQRRKGVSNMKYVTPENDRVIYVFMCIKCQRKARSVRCIRGIRRNKIGKSNTHGELTKELESLAVENKLQQNPFDFCKENSSNPFGSNPFQSTNSDMENSQSQFTNQKTSAKDSAKTIRKLHDAQKDKPFDSQKGFKNYLLYVEEESFINKKPDHLKLPKNLKIDDASLDLNDEIEADFDKDPIKLDPRTEKLSKFLDDEVFQKFQEVVAYNPLQVLRYDIGSRPLLYAKCKPDFESTVPNPGYNPSSKRVFELQLMPKMILDLEERTTLEEGMEWGTILVYTDIENYVPKFDHNDVGYVEEFVKVQWEA